MHNNAMRWLGRASRPMRAAPALASHDSSLILLRRLRGNPPVSRTLCNASRLQARATPSLSASASPAPAPSSTSSAAQGAHPRRPGWLLIALTFAASAGAAYLYRRRSVPLDDDVINMSTFSAFTVTAREQVSPTAFIIALRPSAWVDPDELEHGHTGGDESTFLSSRIQEAWHHGLWSVEIKQPQLQIARHYTPLPPLAKLTGSSSADDDEEQADLRILIRRMDGGEMSNYLSRQSIGDTVWLRGPHLGFDIPRRLGDGAGGDSDCETGDVREQRGVVFLAGGTGIAPALQIAHKLLDSHDPSKSEESRPHISILWANRWSVDALGRKQPPPIQGKSNSWFRFWSWGDSSPGPDLRDESSTPGREPASSLALQVQDLQRRHPAHFDISYFVDDEGSFIKAHDVEAALASIPKLDANGTSSSSPGINRNCTWHSAKAVALLPDDNDAARSSSSDPSYACTCTQKTGAEAPAGVNVICVSGPDGFIEAYAGAKRWHGGNEMQGVTRGLLGRILKDKGKKVGEWLVLKL